MRSVILGYTTFPDEKTAESVCKTLLMDKLVACVNLLPQGLSFYEWEGEIKHSTEVIAFMKTTPALVPAIVECLKTHHPHICPCFLTFPSDDGLPEFLDWVRSSVKGYYDTTSN